LHRATGRLTGAARWVALQALARITGSGQTDIATDKGIVAAGATEADLRRVTGGLTGATRLVALHALVGITSSGQAGIATNEAIRAAGAIETGLGRATDGLTGAARCVARQALVGITGSGQAGSATDEGIRAAFAIETFAAAAAASGGTVAGAEAARVLGATNCLGATRARWPTRRAQTFAMGGITDTLARCWRIGSEDGVAEVGTGTVTGKDPPREKGGEDHPR
jgi:hypothetical protein